MDDVELNSELTTECVVFMFSVTDFLIYVIKMLYLNRLDSRAYIEEVMDE